MTSPHMSEQEVERISRREAIAIAEESIQRTSLGGFQQNPTVYRPALAELIIAAKQWDEHSAALTAAAQVRERAAYEREEREYAGLMPIYGATEDPSAAELAVGQIVTVVTVTDDGVETERVPWSEIMNPSGGNIDDLGRAQRAAKGHSNVARDNAAVAEAAIAEVDRLRAALETIAGLPDVRCDEAPTVARNTLNDGTRPGPFPTEPDSGPDVLGEQKGEE